MPVRRGSGGRAFLAREELAGPARLPDGPGPVPRLIGGYEESRRMLTAPAWSRAGAVHRVPVGPATAMSVTDMDPPHHTRVRALLNGSFSARAVRAHRPGLEQRARDLVARMREAGGAGDVLEAFCRPFAFAAHCDVLGVPEAVRPALRHWSVARTAGAGAAVTHRAELRLHDLVRPVLDRPGPGLLGALADACAAGRLTRRELTGLSASLFFDGHVLAAAQLANALLCLVLVPSRLDRLREHTPALVGPVVEEALRCHPAITLSMVRTATTGPAVSAAAVIPLANRDPRVFADPDRFDPDRFEVGPGRSPRRHLSFGRGPHHCPGAELTRLQLRIGLAALVHGLPGLRLAVDEATLTWSVSPAVRTLDALPVRWTGA